MGKVSEDTPLTQAQEIFCNKFVEVGNASEAYRNAYPKSLLWKDSTVWEQASRLLAVRKVSARVDELREEARRNSDVTKAEIIALCRDIIRGVNKPDSVDETVINGIKKKKVRGMSKMWAVERLCKMLGFDGPTEIQLKKSAEDEMSIEDMEKEINRLTALDGEG